MKRRDFIYAFFRVSLLVSMAVLVGFFAAGKKIGLNEECIERSQCRTCGKLNRCDFPEAKKIKQNG